ncbi:MAG: hypothetical protein HKN70_10610 [Gammaproteobacteria bacterium]|nr:hypothetical protein [Gammaproteobacteria bacterium]
MCTASTWRRILIILTTCFAASFSVAAAGDQDLVDIARKINDLFEPPVMINQDTRFEGVEAATLKEMVFQYTLVYMTVNSEYLPPVVAELKESILASSCDQQDWRKYLGAGIAITVLYRTIDGEEALRLTTSPHQCGL